MPVTADCPSGRRYRRASGLVLYWDRGLLVARTWRGAVHGMTQSVVTLLDVMGTWGSAEVIRNAWMPGAEVPDVASFLEELCGLDLLEREGDAVSAEAWAAWSPEATFFHFATKDAAFPSDPLALDATLRERAKHDPPPAPTKVCEGPRQKLPVGLEPEALAAVLTGRRTWRRFSPASISSGQLGTLLRLTFAVQRRGVVTGQGEVVLKTSPSGGARHAIEAYVLAWNVGGLEPGVYHYDASADELVGLRRGMEPATIEALLAHQHYFARAGAVVVMCPVFARAMWRYPHPRAYRSILIEAGHLGQTFCLVATALGLAPFTTMAFSERRLETLLGLDGVQECPVYMAGVGTRDDHAAFNPGALSAGAGE